MMMPATNKQDCETIEEDVKKRTANRAIHNKPHYRYLTIREYGYCELEGCTKYEVVWLDPQGLVEHTVYIDNTKHTIEYGD